MLDQETHAVVIGAGPSGLAAAYRLQQSGIRPVILEQTGHIGGLMRSVKRGAFTVDLGRKELYTRIPEVSRLWHELLGDDYREYPHRVGSLYAGRILEMSGAYCGVCRGIPMPLLAAGGLDLGITWALNCVRRPSNYEEYWYQRVGSRFARVFAQGYWEKFRGQKWRDLPVPLVHADGQQSHSYSFARIAQALRLAGQGGASSQRWWRHPALGSGQICEKMAEMLSVAGAGIRMDTRVVGMTVRSGMITGVEAEGPSGKLWFRPRYVVSSARADVLAGMLGAGEEEMQARRAVDGAGNNSAAAPARTVKLIYLFADEKPRFPHAWLEVNDRALTCGRITNYAAFKGDMVPEGKTALCVEFFLNSGDPMLQLSEEEWTRIAIDECSRGGLIDPAKITDTMMLSLDRCDAAASWREAQRGNMVSMLDTIGRVRNLYHVNRPGTDWATYAGLIAADAIAADNRHSFDSLADPTRSYAESQQAAGNVAVGC